MNPKPPRPTNEPLRRALRQPSDNRSLSVTEARERDNLGRLARYFCRNAQVIRVPFTLESLANSRVDKKELERVCERLQNQEAQVMSAIFKDPNDEIILAYCAHRPLRDANALPLEVSSILFPSLVFIVFVTIISLL